MSSDFLKSSYADDGCVVGKKVFSESGLITLCQSLRSVLDKPESNGFDRDYTIGFDAIGNAPSSDTTMCLCSSRTPTNIIPADQEARQL